MSANKNTYNHTPVMNFNCIGIDIGLRGGITSLTIQDGKVIAANIIDTPLNIISKHLDTEELALWICDNTFMSYPFPTYIFFEEAHAMPHQGVVSMFSFGRSFGGIESMVNVLKLIAKGHNMELYGFIISPKAWQKGVIENHTFLKKYRENKHRNVEVALKLFPQLSERFYGPNGGLKDGRVDSLLLAEFGRRVITHEIPDFFLIKKLTKKRLKIPHTKRNVLAQETVRKFYKITEEAIKLFKNKRFNRKISAHNNLQRVKGLYIIKKKLEKLRTKYPELDKKLRRKGL